MDNFNYDFNDKNTKEEDIDKTRELSDSDLFNIKLMEESEELNSLKEGKKKSKKHESSFFSRHKKFFIVFFSSIAIVISIALIIYGVRISKVTKDCKRINSQGYYSRQYITDELKAKGYNDFEINRAITKNKINFESNINKCLLKLIEEPTSFLNKDKLIFELSKQGYTDSEIENLFLILNWEEFLNKYLENYFSSKTDSIINKRDLITTLQVAGFDQKDIDIFASSTQWVELGKKYIKKYFEENPNVGKTDVREYLDGLGFSIGDIDVIFDSVDWKKQALACINRYIESISNGSTSSTRITETLFRVQLEKLGFNDDEIQYTIDNYDFSSAIEIEIKNLIKADNNLVRKNTIKDNLKKMNYSDEDIEKVFDTMKWEEYALSTCTQHLTTNKANKNDSLNFLKNNGYTDIEIDYAKSKISWSTYATKALGYLQDGNNKKKDELFTTLESYGYTQDEIYTAKNSVTSYVKYAYNYVMNTQSSDALSKMSQGELQAILTNGGYGDEYNAVVSGAYFNFTKNASNYLASIMTSFLNEPKIYSVQNDIVGAMQNKGFTSYQSVINNYDWLNFAKEWANKYFAKNEVNKDEFLGTSGTQYEGQGIFESLKANVDETISLKNKYTILPQTWRAEAIDIARAHIGEGEDKVLELLNSLGYSDISQSVIDEITN